MKEQAACRTVHPSLLLIWKEMQAPGEISDGLALIRDYPIEIRLSERIALSFWCFQRSRVYSVSPLVSRAASKPTRVTSDASDK
jgi:hypothetical protein